ncbi:protein YmgL, partial [Escherichia coli]
MEIKVQRLSLWMINT